MLQDIKERDGVRASLQVCGAFTPKWGEKGWSSKEMGIMRELLRPGSAWMLGNTRGADRLKPKRSSKMFSCVVTFRETSRLCLAVTRLPL